MRLTGTTVVIAVGLLAFASPAGTADAQTGGAADVFKGKSPWWQTQGQADVNKGAPRQAQSPADVYQGKAPWWQTQGQADVHRDAGKSPRSGGDEARGSAGATE